MANGNEDPNAVGNALVEDERRQQNERGPVGRFFRDPKNLATMLVLGAALAQNRRGQSFGAHLGRGVVGSLAFRGGLDRDIEDRRREQAAAQSEADFREGQISVAQSRNDIARDANTIQATGNAQQVLQSELDRQASMNELQAQIDAGRFTHPPNPAADPATLLLKAGLDAYYTDLAAFRQGFLDTQPDIRNYVVLPEGFSLQALPRREDDTQVDADPDDDVVVDSPEIVQTATEQLHPDATPTERRLAAEADQRAANREGRSTVAQSIRTGEITDATEAERLRARIREWRDLSDEEVIQRARAMDSQLQAAIGSVESLRELDRLRTLAWAASPAVRQRFLDYRSRVYRQFVEEAQAERMRRGTDF